MKGKRVRYLAGAAGLGLVPAATGLAVPTAAQASTGCVGHTAFTLPQLTPVRGHGWFTKEANGKICIGTVVVSVYTSSTGTDWPIYGVSNAGGTRIKTGNKKITATKGTWVHASFGVHSSFSSYIYVRGWSNYESHGVPYTYCHWHSGNLFSCNAA